MHRILQKAFFALWFFLPALAPAAGTYTWANVWLGAGGFVDGIVPSPAQSGLIYARTDVGGAYLWSDATQAWTPLTDMFPASEGNYLGIESIAPDPTNADNVYAAAGMYESSGDGVILSSTNQGASWTANPIAVVMGGNDTGRGMGERLAVDPNLPSTLYFGSRENGLWTSADSAAAWTQVTAFPTEGESLGGSPDGLTCVIVDPQGGTSGTASQILFVAAASTAAGSNLYESVNGGTSWTEVAGGPSGLFVHHAGLSSDGYLYLAYSNDPGPYNVTGVTLQGQIWRLQVSTLAWTNITPPTAAPQSWAGMAGGLSVDAENPQHVVVSTLDSYGPDRVLATTDAENAAPTWTVIGEPWAGYGAGSQAACSTYNLNGVLWWEADALSLGESAAELGTGPTNWVEAVAVDPFNSDRVFHGTGGGVWQSTDTEDAEAGENGEGVTWNFYDVGLEETVPLYLAPSVSGNFLSTVGDIDGTQNTALNAYSTTGEYQDPYSQNGNWLDFAESNPDFMVRTSNNATLADDVAYSTDNGAAWTACTGAIPGATAGDIDSVAANAAGTVIVASPSSGDGTPAWSSNDGASWTACAGLPSGAVVAADRVSSTLFYATSGGILYVSTNSGQSFSSAATFAAGSGQYSDAPRPCFLEQGEVWVATGTNLYRFTGLGTAAATGGQITSATDVTGVGFGVALTPTAHPAVYIIGDVGGTYGFWRNDDGAGDSWTQMNDPQHQYGWLQGNYIAGDEKVYGRCYLTTGGRGYIYGSLDTTPTATASPTDSPTLTASPSPTLTATRTATPSATGTDSPTASPTSSPTPTLSATGTATPTATGTYSPTISSTTTASSVPTASATPTATESPSQAVSPTPTASLTANPALSPTASPTLSPTGSASPTVSASPTPSSTATLSATLTASLSPTVIPSPSATATLSTTLTASPSATATLSPSATATGSASPTASASSTPTGSATATPTATASPSPSATLTLSPSVTATASSTVTVSATLTAPPSATPTLSPTASVPSTTTVSATATQTATASAVPTVAESLTATATSAPGGPLVILGAVPVPNPDPAFLAVDLAGPADAVSVRVYTKALVLARSFEAQGLVQGWNKVALPADWTELPDGLYYVLLRASRGPVQSAPVSAKVFVAR